MKRLLGVEIARSQRVAGGCVSDGRRVELTAGRVVFAKTKAPPGAFAAEARSLRWLAETRTVRVPDVLQVSETQLVLEWIAPGPALDDERLGRELAMLHQSGAPAFGLDQDGYLATLPQANGATADWPSFYYTSRIEPLARLAVDRGLLKADLKESLAALERRLPELVGPPEPPARLHGDLWGGNVIAAAEGQPVLIDPAAYGGHREVDLAMMRLFGGFSARCFEAYGEVHPLANGHDERVKLYQLYPLLAHVLLFGRSYMDQTMSALKTYV